MLFFELDGGYKLKKKASKINTLAAALKKKEAAALKKKEAAALKKKEAAALKKKIDKWWKSFDNNIIKKLLKIYGSKELAYERTMRFVGSANSIKITF